MQRGLCAGGFAAGLIALLAYVMLSQRDGGNTMSERRGNPKLGRLEKTDAEWRAELPPEVYQVARQHGTERAFSGALWNTKDDGVYRCACCDQPLFDSAEKFDSGTGWPSYWQPVDEENISLHTDRSLFMRRTEVLCSRCDAHLGHVFDDGPPPTNQRWCNNGVSLRFIPKG